ncbi:hypothetical protein D3C80_1925120 [compost metagenome]
MIAKSEIIRLTILVHDQKFYESFFVSRWGNSDGIISLSRDNTIIIGTKIFYMAIIDKGVIAFYP